MAALLSYENITSVMISPENQKGTQILELPKITSIQFQEMKNLDDFLRENSS
jgi:hypothetical protein